MATQLIAEIDLLAAESSSERAGSIGTAASLVGACRAERFDIASLDAGANERKEMWADLVDSSSDGAGELRAPSIVSTCETTTKGENSCVNTSDSASAGSGADGESSSAVFVTNVDFEVCWLVQQRVHPLFLRREGQ